MNNPITPTLDKIEANLPKVAGRLFNLNRTIAGTSYDAVAASASAVCSATKSVNKRATTGAKTVFGQAESVADRVATTARSGAKEVVGQVKAQTDATLDVLEDETIDLINAADATVDGTPQGAYETRTKGELYERAQELDIAGRSTMTKTQLIAALRAAN